MSGPVGSVVSKEFRALFPLWVAAALTVLLEPLLGETASRFFPVAVFTFVVGALSLGAHAIGHEYTNRTLGMLLVQPWKRSSMLATKAAVLLAMLLALAAVAWPVLRRTDVRAFGPFTPEWQLVLPLVGGLFVAPGVTMRLRSQMAGVVFTAAIPGSMYLLALVAASIVYGTGTDAAERIAVAVWKPAMLIVAAAGGILTAWSFMHLQTIDGEGEELALPRWLMPEDRSSVRPPLWMLVKKELRLQQMTFVLAALYALIWTALMVTRRLNPDFEKRFPLEAVGMLYFAVLPLLIGSLASAQERQFGMLGSQSMLPVPAAQQWGVKAAVVLVLALGLGVLLPWFAFAPSHLSPHSVWPMAGTIVLLTLWSLYISSWCGSGVIALALVLPASAAAVILARWIDWTVMGLLLPRHPLLAHGMLTRPPVMFAAMVLTLAPLAALLLFFGGRNHWMPERKLGRFAVQVAWLAGWFVLTDVVATVL